MANLNPKTEHLEASRWQPGQSGNPDGRPKGSKNLSTWIRSIMDDEEFGETLRRTHGVNGTPIEAIIKSLVIKALNGNLRAFELLAKYGYGTKPEEIDRPCPIPILGGLSRSHSIENHDTVKLDIPG